MIVGSKPLSSSWPLRIPRIPSTSYPCEPRDHKSWGTWEISMRMDAPPHNLITWLNTRVLIGGEGSNLICYDADEDIMSLPCQHLIWVQWWTHGVNEVNELPCQSSEWISCHFSYIVVCCSTSRRYYYRDTLYSFKCWPLFQSMIQYNLEKNREISLVDWHHVTQIEGIHWSIDTGEIEVMKSNIAE